MQYLHLNYKVHFYFDCRSAELDYYRPYVYNFVPLRFYESVLSSCRKKLTNCMKIFLSLPIVNIESEFVSELSNCVQGIGELKHDVFLSFFRVGSVSDIPHYLCRQSLVFQL